MSNRQTIYQIQSMNYYPLFRVRSWNNGVRCMSLYIRMFHWMQVYVRGQIIYTKLKLTYTQQTSIGYLRS